MGSLSAYAHTASCIAVASLLAAAPAIAQTSVSAAPGAPAAPVAITGAWSGEFFVTQGQGPLSMTFTHGLGGWSGTFTITTPDETTTGGMRKIVVDSAGVTFEATIQAADVTFTAHLVETELAGTLVAVQNGHTVAQGQWSARRQP